eukprot:g44553.t1
MAPEDWRFCRRLGPVLAAMEGRHGNIEEVRDVTLALVAPVAGSGEVMVEEYQPNGRRWSLDPVLVTRLKGIMVTSTRQRWEENWSSREMWHLKNGDFNVGWVGVDGGQPPSLCYVSPLPKTDLVEFGNTQPLMSSINDINCQEQTVK